MKKKFTHGGLFSSLHSFFVMVQFFYVKARPVFYNYNSRIVNQMRSPDMKNFSVLSMTQYISTTHGFPDISQAPLKLESLIVKFAQKSSTEKTSCIEDDLLKKCYTTDESNKFLVAVFHLGKVTFHSVPHLCFCDKYIENNYDSCSEFEEHDIAVCNLNKVELSPGRS